VDRDRPEPLPRPFSEYAGTPPGKLRIAYSTKVPPLLIARLEDEQRRAFEQTLELLRSLGHELAEQDPDYGYDTGPSVLTRYLRGGHDEAHALPHYERLSRNTRGFAKMGALVPSALLEWSRSGEAALTARLNRVLESNDVLITPATAQPPPRIGQFDGRGALWTLNGVIARVPYNAPWNLTGQPAAAVPAGLGSDGLPRSVQIVGRSGDEGTLLSLSAQIEAERPWAHERPAGFV
jgi:amidase